MSDAEVPGALDVPDDTTPTARRDDLLLAAILGGANNRQAAEASGYGVATVDRRMRDPKFRRRVQSGRAALQERTLTALLAAGTAGVQTLIEAASGPVPRIETTVDAEGNTLIVQTLGVPWAQRVSAARALVELGVGALARQPVDLDAPDATVIQEAESKLTEKLAGYAEQIPAALRVVEATATEAPPKRARRAK